MTVHQPKPKSSQQPNFHRIFAQFKTKDEKESLALPLTSSLWRIFGRSRLQQLPVPQSHRHFVIVAYSSVHTKAEFKKVSFRRSSRERPTYLIKRKVKLLRKWYHLCMQFLCLPPTRLQLYDVSHRGGNAKAKAYKGQREIVRSWNNKKDFHKSTSKHGALQSIYLITVSYAYFRYPHSSFVNFMSSISSHSCQYTTSAHPLSPKHGTVHALFIVHVSCNCQPNALKCFP